MEIESFYNSLLVKYAFADYTIEGYKRVLSKFIKDVGTNEPTEQQIENYVAGMRKKKLSYSHVRNTTVILEKFSGFLGRTIKLGRMRRPKSIVKDILTEGEIARILGACKNSREKTIISILAYSGIRNKDRLAYISRECAKIIADYLVEYPRSKDRFLTTALASGKQYSGWALRKRLKVVAGRAEIKKRVYPHLMRHSLASHLVSKNCSILTLMNLLGHSQLNTTQLYLRSFPQKIQAEYNYLVPNYL